MIRTHGRNLLCTECEAMVPFPHVPKLTTDQDENWRRLAAAETERRRIGAEFYAAHAGCVKVPEGYVTERGVRVVDRRRVRG